MSIPDSWKFDFAGSPVTLPVVPVRGTNLYVPYCAASRLNPIDMEAIAYAIVTRIVELNIHPEYVLGIMSEGHMIAREVARLLGVDLVFPFTKTIKVLDEPEERWVVHEYQSVTSAQMKQLAFCRTWADQIRGKPGVLIEDVIATGGTLNAAFTILQQLGLLHPELAMISAFAEGREDEWRPHLAEYMQYVHFLYRMPLWEE